MTITALPVAPDPATMTPEEFSEAAAAFVAALATFVTEANALAVAMNLNSTNDTSASSVAIGTGSKSFTVSTGKSYQPGMYLVIADTAAPSTNSMFGQITSYNTATGALVVNVLSVAGSGTITAWTISQTSAGGAALGANGDITALTGLIGPGLVPVGTIIHVPQNAAPTGYVKANGALLSRTTYAGLYAVAVASGNMAASDGAWVAGQYSPGDGTTTFRIPDARGEFVRGWDDSRGVDSGRAIGTAQAGQNESHTHILDAHQYVWERGSGGVGGYGAGTILDRDAGGSTAAAGGTEARPRNIALLACIKF